jgi:hypothetical protein
MHYRALTNSAACTLLPLPRTVPLWCCRGALLMTVPLDNCCGRPRGQAAAMFLGVCAPPQHPHGACVRSCCGFLGWDVTATMGLHHEQLAPGAYVCYHRPSTLSVTPNRISSVVEKAGRSRCRCRPKGMDCIMRFFNPCAASCVLAPPLTPPP